MCFPLLYRNIIAAEQRQEKWGAQLPSLCKVIHSFSIVYAIVALEVAEKWILYRKINKGTTVICNHMDQFLHAECRAKESRPKPSYLASFCPFSDV